MDIISKKLLDQFHDEEPDIFIPAGLTIGFNHWVQSALGIVSQSGFGKIYTMSRAIITSNLPLRTSVRKAISCA